MNFSVVNLGCKVNRIESDTIDAELANHGHSTTSGADVVVINTCTVTGEAEKKARKATRRALKDNPAALVFVTGCAASINPDEFSSIDDRVHVVEKTDVVRSVLNATSAVSSEKASSVTADSGSDSDDVHELSDQELSVARERSDAGFRTRVGVKVQDGCDNACTYCIVHVARGKARSRDVASCVDEVARLGRSGVREVVLSGIDIGNYHATRKVDGASGFGESVGLCGLLRLMRDAAPNTRLRVSSVEPAGVTDELLSYMASQDGMVCRHLHIPLQSGSSRVLRDMNRPYSARQFVDLIDHARSIVPGLSVSTDVIVGFPGETDQDFAKTIDVSRACKFSKIHVFRYSMREGTVAARRDDQVPAEVKAQRARDLGKLAWILRIRDAQERIGSTERVVALGNGIGMSESYHDVRIDDDVEPGRMLPYTFSGLTKDGFFTV